MDKQYLIRKLNWFYSLELNQVDLYTAQSKTFKNSYPGTVFERIAFIEQNHVDNIAEKIKELGSQPTRLGDVITPIIGKIAGKLVSFTGLEYTLKANAFLEQKAMDDYSNLIKYVRANTNDHELLKLLKHNYVEEDLHTAWFNTYLKKLSN